MELDALQQALPELQGLGADFVTISPQLPKFSRNFVKQKKYSFELLSDPGNRTARDYGLAYSLAADLQKIYLQFGLDVPKHNGDSSWTLPLPARYIIDRNAVVRYAQVDPDYTIRPEPEHTLAVLRELQA